MVDGLTLDMSLNFPGNIMVKKFENGKMYNRETLATIRERLNKEE